MARTLSQQKKAPASVGKTKGSAQNNIRAEDLAAHDWYRFVLSFPPHLVRQYVREFGLDNTHTVLDPFCGTGTTIVECRKLGIPSLGIEANPIAYFASSVKVDWDCDPDGLLEHAQEIADETQEDLEKQEIQDSPFFSAGKGTEQKGLRKLPPEADKLLLRDSISALPLHKTLVLLDRIMRRPDEHYVRYEKLALAKALVTSVGNLHFGPEVGVRKKKVDAPVIEPWLWLIRSMAKDLGELQELPGVPAGLYLGDSRNMPRMLKPRSVDAVITSPPYPNEKDYTRTTRLESVILGFLHTRKDLREMKQSLLRSNTRNVYKGDDDDQWIADNSRVQEISREIESRRIALGKTSGFERLYHKVTKQYFGGMKRHLADLRNILRPGARLAYVVGDQASYLRVMIRTGDILAEIAKSLGYELVRKDLFRTRLATATRERLSEEVLVLRWPGCDEQRTQ